MERRFGWRKDPYSPKDYLHRAIAEIPDSVDLKKYLPAVRQQGNVGSCVGFGVGVNLSAWASKLGVFTEWFSPTWIYNGARFIEGTLLSDEGCYARDALDWLVKKGCLLEHFWPYNEDKLDTSSPPSKLDSEAAKYPLLKYFRVTGGVTGICSALAQGFLVSIGTPWFDKWMDTDSQGRLPVVKSTDGIAGGHETCISGYDKVSKYFFGINSWGDNWGKSGFYLMPFSAFDIFGKVGGYDAFYITVEWKVAPQPIPAIQIKIREQYSLDGGTNWTTIDEKP